MQHIYWYPHSKEAEFYKLLLDYDEGLERDLADCGAIWYESWTQNLMAWDYWMSDRIESMIISKNFWFIERLVDNKKIDERKIDTRLVRYVESHYDEEWYWVENSYEDYSDTNTLIMLLSISKTPIEDLIDYLR